MKNKIILLILFLFSLNSFAQTDQEVKTEANKHSYETYFVMLNEKEFNIYYKDNYGNTKIAKAISNEDQFTYVQIAEHMAMCLELADGEGFKHEYNSFFAVKEGEEFYVFYKDKEGSVIPKYVTSDEFQFEEKTFEEATEDLDLSEKADELLAKGDEFIEEADEIINDINKTREEKKKKPITFWRVVWWIFCAYWIWRLFFD